MVHYTDNSISRSIPLTVIEAADSMINHLRVKPAGWTSQEGPIKFKIPFYALFPDCVNKECVFVLERHLDGHGVFVRYYRHQIIMA